MSVWSVFFSSFCRVLWVRLPVDFACWGIGLLSVVSLLGWLRVIVRLGMRWLFHARFENVGAVSVGESRFNVGVQSSVLGQDVVVLPVRH